MSKLPSWTYRGKVILTHDDLPAECTDIVYLLTFSNGKGYYGKRTVRSLRRLRPTKEQLAIRKNYRRVEMKDIPFQKYTGSSKENDGLTIVGREIIFLCSNKRTATYLEAKMLFVSGAVESDDNEYTNANISGRFFTNCLDGFIE